LAAGIEKCRRVCIISAVTHHRKGAMLKRFLWKYFVRRVARTHGFLDPVGVLSRLSLFAQPSEVAAPTELLRAAAILHARGLVNAQVIQHNLDWIWPYWVNRQFDPYDESFIPRAFSLTHINLTHRNWTAVGLPDVEETPLVDPRGLVVPFWDGWAIDAWVTSPERKDLIPARLMDVSQYLDLRDGLCVVTESSLEDVHLTSRVCMIRENGQPVCRARFCVRAKKSGHLTMSLRPCNPEGVSFVSDISVAKDGPGWMVNKKEPVRFNVMPQRYAFSNYQKGDVYHALYTDSTEEHIHCPSEMASAAAMFPLDADGVADVTVSVPLKEKPRTQAFVSCAQEWNDSLKEACGLEIPDEHFKFLWEAALRTVLIHSAGVVYAGPYTYKRFWVRDAVFIGHTLLNCGFFQRAQRIIGDFEQYQKLSGYFESQEGEWDSNGQVLWLMQKFCAVTHQEPSPRWRHMAEKAAGWILKKRLAEDIDKPHAGLMPSGFSAEHFGPNDFYYWDDFWSAAGLRAASLLTADAEAVKIYEAEADSLLQSIYKSLEHGEARLKRPAMPSSPYRRFDSACVGSLAAGYPLQLWGQADRRLLDTVEYLLENCLVHDGFFHDMSHSGINPYLTLHIAQVLLRAGDARYFRLVKGIADLASATGQWPEAIHPRTKGGCMGDGQHVWAAAEWLMMMRHCFVREEGTALILCQGLPAQWLDGDQPVRFGPAPTEFGTVSLEIRREGKDVRVQFNGKWHDKEPVIEIHAPSFIPARVDPGQNSVILKKM